MRTPLAAPANPGAAADATIWDDGPTAAAAYQKRPVSPGRGMPTEAARVRVAVFMDQNATFKVDWFAPGSTNARRVNGGGAGEAITLNVLFTRDVLLQPGRTKIYITTATAPTVWEVGAEVVDDQGLS